jgi:hypothetical protein
VEVLSHREDQSLILRYSLDLVAPLARDLDRSLHRLGSRVHGQDHVEAKQLGSILGEAGEHIVVECSAAECQARCLLSQSLDKLRVAVALVYSAVCREEVKVVLVLGVPHTAATCSREDCIGLDGRGQRSVRDAPIGNGW